MKGSYPACAKCPYYLGFIKTLVSPCPTCMGKNLWIVEDILRKKNEQRH